MILHRHFFASTVFLFFTSNISSVFANGGLDFTGIVSLDGCSGALVRFSTSLPTDQSMILTNGHCYDEPLYKDDVKYEIPSKKRFQLLNADSSPLAELTASHVIYATMARSDMALYRLTLTFGEIESKYHVQALTISNQRANEGASIQIVSGYHKKIYSCNIDHFVYEMHEGEWVWKDSILYTQPGCEIIGGTSGSPIIDFNSGEIVGVNNTANDNGETCTGNNPCEIDEQGHITVTKGAAYGQQVYWIYSCLTETNSLDLLKEGCLLKKP